MASVQMDIPLNTDPAKVWDAVADFGAVHERLCPGVLLDSRTEGDGRVVTFAHGPVVREVLVDVDDAARRLVYAVVESSLPFTHHQASMQVIADGSGTRLVWISDLLPDDLAPTVSSLMAQGAEAMTSLLGG